MTVKVASWREKRDDHQPQLFPLHYLRRDGFRAALAIASSTSGILPSALQDEMTYPERLLVAHPLNPVYLIPLVELVGGKKTAEGVIARASDFLESMGMVPLRVRREIEGFIAT